MSLKDLLKKKKEQKEEEKQPADRPTVDNEVKAEAGKEPIKEKEKEEKQVKAPTEEKQAVSGGASISHRILLKPLVTEKISSQTSQGKYAFVVADKANKVEVAKAIWETYGVWPAKVNIMNYQGKAVRFGRVFGRRKKWKKAIITLPQGKTIDIYKGV